VTPPEHGRLAWLAPEELTDAQRKIYDRITAGARAQHPPPFQLTDARGRLEGPFNAMLLNPTVGNPLERLGAAIRFRTALSDRSREIAILAVAAHRRSDFEWYAHEVLARECGITGAEVSALKEQRTPDTLRAEERVVHRLALALCTDLDLDDNTFGEGERVLGTALLDEVVTLVGYYQLLATSLRVWRTPLPDGVPAPFDPDG
jgi:hypothetical protein